MGLLNQPLFNMGLGLVSESGPSFRPSNYGRGVMTGLLNARQNRIAMQQQQRAEQEHLMALARFNMEQLRYQEEQKQKAAEAERRRIFLSTLPPEQHASFRADPSSFMTAYNEKQFEPEPDRKIEKDVSGRWRFVDTGEIAFPDAEVPTVERKREQDVNNRWRYLDTGELVYPDVEKEPETMTPYQEESLALEREKIEAAKEEKEKEKEEKQRLAEEHAAVVKSSVKQAMRQALGAQQSWFAGGAWGSLLADVTPGKGLAHDTLRKAANTIKSNLALEELTKLKERGGTLGALNATEFAALEGKISGLNPDGDMDIFMEDLRYIARYLDIDFNQLFSQFGGDSGQGQLLQQPQRMSSNIERADAIVGRGGQQ